MKNSRSSTERLEEYWWVYFKKTAPVRLRRIGAVFVLASYKLSGLKAGNSPKIISDLFFFQILCVSPNNNRNFVFYYSLPETNDAPAIGIEYSPIILIDHHEEKQICGCLSAINFFHLLFCKYERPKR